MLFEGSSLSLTDLAWHFYFLLFLLYLYITQISTSNHPKSSTCLCKMGNGVEKSLENGKSQNSIEPVDKESLSQTQTYPALENAAGLVF